MLIESSEGRVTSRWGKVLHVFYDFEASQNTDYADEDKLHVPNLVCEQQFCSRGRCM